MVETQRSVSVGDEVMTNAGFFGRVTAEVDDPAAGDCLMLEVSPGTEVKIARGAVLRVVVPPTEDLEVETAPDTDVTESTDSTDNDRSN
jgi:preprotein translocase subunit YajC